MSLKEVLRDTHYWLKPSRIPLAAALLFPIASPVSAQPTPGVVTSGTVESLDGDRFVLYSGPTFSIPRDTVDVMEGPGGIKGYYIMIDEYPGPLELIAKNLAGDMIAHTAAGTTFYATDPPTYDNNLRFEAQQVGTPSLETHAEPRPWPNPFSHRTAWDIAAPAGHDAQIRASIYDTAGRVIRNLFEGRAYGLMRLEWDGRRDDGRAAASGIYLIHTRVDCADEQGQPVSLRTTQKVVKLK
ncbi:MAG: hypothetical protein ABIH41_00485 [Nanoarchaeota archaeon]